jgi:hypothetical protein
VSQPLFITTLILSAEYGSWAFERRYGVARNLRVRALIEHRKPCLDIVSYPTDARDPFRMRSACHFCA